MVIRAVAAFLRERVVGAGDQRRDRMVVSHVVLNPTHYRAQVSGRSALPRQVAGEALDPIVDHNAAFGSPVRIERHWPVLDAGDLPGLSLIHISEPTRLLSISYAVF